MSLSTLSKINLVFFLVTGCCPYKDSIDIPQCWHTPLEQGITLSEPACFLWWEPFCDTWLTFLIEQAQCYNDDVKLAALQSEEKRRESINNITAEVGKTYFELRGFQAKQQLLLEHLKGQKEIFTLSEGLTTLSEIDQNELKLSLNTLQAQASQIALSIDKTIFHLSTLAGYSPEDLYNCLYALSPLPELPGYFPLERPMEVITHHPAAEEARKMYCKNQDRPSFYLYEKKVFQILEETENALATLHYQLHQLAYLKSNKQLKAANSQLAHDLYMQGIIDERTLQTARMELFSAEIALIELKTQFLVNYVALYQQMRF